MRFTTIAITINGPANNTLVAGQAGKRIVVYGMIVAATADEIMAVRSGTTGTPHVGTIVIPVRIELGIPFRLGLSSRPWFQCDVGADLNMIMGAAGDIGGLLVYGFSDKDLETI